VTVLKVVLRYLSLAYHAVLALFLLGLGAVALITGKHNLQLDVVPWGGKILTFGLLAAALLGLLAVKLAFRGRARWFFLAYSVVVFLVMVKGFIFSGYSFAKGGLTTPLLLILGAMLATLYGWLSFRRKLA